MFYLLVLSSLSLLIGFVFSAGLQTHNESFTPDYILHVTYEVGSAACRSKFIALVNGTSPGPQITLQENRTTWVRVFNDMDNQNLTVHWHGLTQVVSPFSDGTPQASQWPIAAQHFFDYELRPNIGDAGSYFYHSHVEFQAVSAAGPLIVEEASGQSPYVYDDEKIMFLSEWFNQTQEEVYDGLTGSPFLFTGETEAILVNSQSYPALSGASVGDPVSNQSYSNDTLTCGPEVFEVDPGKTYRFRAIGGTALSLVSFVFENHSNLTVIAADGHYTQPAWTDRIQIGPGQRFDFLLKTKTQEELDREGKSMFWVQLETRYRTVNVTGYAMLKYNTADSSNSSVPASPPTQHPLFIPDDIQNWLEYTLEPLQPNGFPNADQVNRTVYLISEQLVSGLMLFWTVNNYTWTETNEHLNNTPYNATYPNSGVPYLVDIYQKGEAVIPNYDLAVQQYGGRDPNLNVFAAKVGEIIDIVLINRPNGLFGGFDVHPWHIHGGHVYDLGSGNGSYDSVANEKRLQGYNPVLRDTTNLYKYQDDAGNDTLPAYSNQGWRAWRLRVDDAGVWMVHCHILPHMIVGMQTVWVAGNASQVTKNAEPYVQGYLSFGGSAYGNASHDPLVYHFSDD